MAIGDLLSQSSSSGTGRPVTAQLTGAGHTASGTSVSINVATNCCSVKYGKVNYRRSRPVGSLTVKDTATQTDWKGTLSGTTISNMTIVGGTDRDYSAGAIVELTPIARQWKDIYDWGVAEHNQDGTHSDITADSLATNTIAEGTAGSGVTIDGLNIKDNKLNTNASVPPSALATGALSTTVATSQATTSNSFTDLATAGPAVTATIGANGLALVTISCTISQSSTSSGAIMGVAVSGASTVAVGDVNAIYFRSSNNNVAQTRSFTVLITGLTPGSNTFTAKYRATGATATFADRTLSVIPL